MAGSTPLVKTLVFIHSDGGKVPKAKGERGRITWLLDPSLGLSRVFSLALPLGLPSHVVRVLGRALKIVVVSLMSHRSL